MNIKTAVPHSCGLLFYTHPMRRLRILFSIVPIAGIFLAFMAVLPAWAKPAPRTFVPATDPNITYVGRWGRLRTANGPAMATVNSSSQIYLLCGGSSIRADFDVRHVAFMAQIEARVDRGPWRLFTIDRHRLRLFHHLGPGPHRLEIAVKDVDERGNRWFPPFASAVVFEGLELDAHAAVEKYILPVRPTLMFLGDSITQGVRVVGMQIGVTGSNSLLSYGWLAGQALRTIHYQVAFGRQGVIRSGNGLVPPATLAFGWNFAGSPAGEPAPDFLVINQGTNDIPYPGREYGQALLGYLREIRAYWPHTEIFVLRPFGGFHAASTMQAVELMHDARVIYVSTHGWLKKKDFRDGVHPNRRGSRLAAAHLEKILAPYIARWKPPAAKTSSPAAPATTAQP